MSAKYKAEAKAKAKRQDLSLKAILFFNSHFWILVLAYVAFVFIGGAVFVWLEPEHEGIINGIYWADTVGMTVGFGDVTPKTDTGKIFYMIFNKPLVWVLTSLIIAKFVTAVLLSHNTQTHQEQELVFIYLENISRYLKLPVYKQPHDFLDDEEWEPVIIEGPGAVPQES